MKKFCKFSGMVLIIFSLMGFLSAFWIEFSFNRSSLSKPIDLSKLGVHQFKFKPLLDTRYGFYISGPIDVSSRENFESFKKKATETFRWEIAIENQRNKSIIFKHAGGIMRDRIHFDDKYRNNWSGLIYHYYDSNKEPLIITINLIRPYPISSPQGLLVIYPTGGKEMFLFKSFLLFVSPIPGIVGLILLIIGLRSKNTGPHSNGTR